VALHTSATTHRVKHSTVTGLIRLFVTAFAVSCGKHSAEMPRTRPSQSAASVAIDSVSPQSERATASFRCAIWFSVRESGGKTGATLGSGDLIFSVDPTIGQVDFDNAFTSTTIAFGGSVDVRSFVVIDDIADNAAATGVQVRLRHAVVGSTRSRRLFAVSRAGSNAVGLSGQNRHRRRGRHRPGRPRRRSCQPLLEPEPVR